MTFLLFATVYALGRWYTRKPAPDAELEFVNSCCKGE